MDDVQDPRLDPYRGRAGELSQDGTPVGHLLVESQVAEIKAGGFAWWTRWDAPEEMVVLSALVGGKLVHEQNLLRDELTEAIDAWAHGKHAVGRTTYDVKWLDQAESDRVHHEVFGHHH